MIDEKIIKDTYLRMSATELLYLARTEGNTLTPQARAILYQEFKNRSLDTSLFIRNANDEISFINQKNEEEDNPEYADFIKTIWLYVFREKENGRSDTDIYNGLLQRGLGEEKSAAIMINIEIRALEILAVHNKNVLRGAICSLIGLGICIYTYSDNSTGTIYILAGGAIVFGILLAFKGVSSKSRYKTILANIETERILFKEATTANEIKATHAITPIYPAQPDNPLRDKE